MEKEKTRNGSKEVKLTFHGAPEPDQPFPLLVTFPGGAPPSMVEDRDGDPDSMDVEEDTKIHVSLPTKRAVSSTGVRYPPSKRFVAMERNDVVYYTPEETTSAPQAQYLIGVYDRAKESVHLLSVPSGICTMRRQVVGMHGASSEVTSKGVKADLVSAFGSSKAQRKLQLDEKYRVREESVGSVIKLPSAQHFVSEEEEGKEESSMLPPLDKGASNPAHIYALKDMFPEELWEGLVRHDTFKALSKFVGKRVPLEELAQELTPTWQLRGTPFMSSTVALALRNTTKLTADKRKKCTILLLLSLIKFYRFVLEKRGRFRVPRKKWAEWLNTTEDVACHIVDLFAVSEGMSTSVDEQGQAKVAHYIIVLALMATGWELWLNTLMIDLGIPKKQLSVYCRYAGCRVYTLSNPTEKGVSREMIKECALPDGSMIHGQLYAPYAPNGRNGQKLESRLVPKAAVKSATAMSDKDEEILASTERRGGKVEGRLGEKEEEDEKAKKKGDDGAKKKKKKKSKSKS